MNDINNLKFINNRFFWFSFTHCKRRKVKVEKITSGIEFNIKAKTALFLALGLVQDRETSGGLIKPLIVVPI